MLTLWVGFISFAPLLVTAYPDHESPRSTIDAVLWLHILVQLITWGGLFGVGMVLGITKSRWHVPVQLLSYFMAFIGYILGRSQKSRSFPESAHSTTASLMVLPFLAQLFLGIYLKFRVREDTIRSWAVSLHGIIGKAWLVMAWIQMLLGVIAIRGYCLGGGLSQCLAHYIMGSAFIGYGIILAIILVAGGGRVWYTKRQQYGSKGKKMTSPHSQEWWDGWVIMLWGVINTFTEHQGPLDKWSHKDMQHTTLGVIWWAGGALAIFLARNGKRTVVPALIIIITGWAMSSHSQALQMSTKIHSLFGATLMSAGAARIVEITFVLKDAPSLTGGNQSTEIRAFQHLPPFLLVAGGVLFMSATDEELKAAMSIEMDHVTYVLLMFSLAFIIYLYTNLLLHIYTTTGRNAQTRTVHVSAGGYAPLRADAESGPAFATAFTPAPAYPGVAAAANRNGADAYRIFDAGDSFEDEMEMDNVRT